MKNEEKNDPVDSLLEWHLGLVSEEDREQITAAIGRDPDLAARSERLGRILRPLDHWSVSSGPAQLAESVLAAVERADIRPLSDLAVVPADRGIIRLPFGRLRDLIAVAACLVALLSVSIPGISALRGRSQRALCANNLGDVFRGLSAYQTSFAGTLPFAGYAENASWLPQPGQRSASASNSRHVFLLLKHRFVPRAESFVCPCSPEGRPMNIAEADTRHDFAEAGNICYDSLNLAGQSPNFRPVVPIAYLSDANPLFVNARFNEGVDPQMANSPAHGGCGQTVLMLDGRAEYLRSPIYGSQKDNVWVIEGIRRYSGQEAPSRFDDAFLVPGFPAEQSFPRTSPTH